MLANPLPPIRFSPHTLPGENLQAFALCYLAGYNDADPPSRVVTAFQNAYGVTGLIRVPRVNGGCPGGYIARIDYPWGAHVVVAIEGIKSISQLYTLTTSAANSFFVSEVPGYVVNWAKTYGDVWLGVLATNTTFLAWAAAPGTKISFTGFSAGAAIAEYVAYKFALLAPNAEFRLRKFASPRVASATWNNNCPNNLDRRSYYHWGDNMHMLPDLSPAFTNVSGFQIATGLTPYTLTGGEVAYAPDHNGLLPLRQANIEDKVNFIAGFLRGASAPGTRIPSLFGPATISGGDSVYYHSRESMRLLLNQRAASYDDMAAWRFNYLEFPDENIWQRDWRPGTAWNPAWIAIEVPGPTPFAPDDQTQQVRLHNAVPEPTRPPQNIRIAPTDHGAFNVVDPILQGGRRRAPHHPVGG